PFKWLNPGTRYMDSNAQWNPLPNGMTYQYTPVISGYGSKVFYPTVTSGWENGYGWGSEYTSMPELENSLINYDGSYDSGELAPNLNSVDAFSSDFGGNFENNYVDNVLISNPYMSDTYNFSQMYDPEIHDITNDAGLYNYYDPSGGANPAQYLFLENELTNAATKDSTNINVFDSGTIPDSITEEFLDDITLIQIPPAGYGAVVGGLSNTYANDANFITIYPTTFWGYYGFNCYLDITNPSYNDNKFYVSMYLETSPLTSIELYNNDNFVVESTNGILDLDRYLIQSVSDLRLLGDWTFPYYETYLYYFKVERVTSGTESMQSPSTTEMEGIMQDWSQYLTTPITDDGIYGFEYTYKLPFVSRDSLDSIQLSFEASINSISFEGGNYPLSIRLWNYDSQRWESIPIAPMAGDNTYLGNSLDYDFWTWDPAGSSPSTDKFRPEWGTLGNNRVNTIGYGATFPHTVDASDNIIYDSSLINGGSFLVNDDTDHQLNNLYSAKEKVLFYDDQYVFLADEVNSNKHQLQNVVISPSNFYASLEAFPDYIDSESFMAYSSDNFYNYFVNDLREFKIQIATEKESSQNDSEPASLCIDSVNTYSLTTTNYLNYDEFESNTINGEHISDKIIFNSDGIRLFGTSGFSLKEAPPTVKFRDNFLTSSWTLEDVSSPTIDYQNTLGGETYISSHNPNNNYNGIDYLRVYQDDTSVSTFAHSASIIKGNYISGDAADTWYDDSNYYKVSSVQMKPWSSPQIADIEFPLTSYSPTEDIYYEIRTDQNAAIYIYLKSTPPFSQIIIESATDTNLISGVISNIDRELDYPNIYVKAITGIGVNFELSVDLLRVEVPVAQEFETYIETTPAPYLIRGDSDSWTLQADLLYDWGGDTQIYSVGSFDEYELRWNNKGTIPIYSFIDTSSEGAGYINWDLGEVSSQPQYFKIDTSQNAGKDFTNPVVKYSIAKKHQEAGLLYMQTDEVAGELLTLRSSYPTTTILPSDQIVVEFKTTTNDQVDLKLYKNGGTEYVETFNIVPQGNSDFSSQIILFDPQQNYEFDELIFTGTLDNGEYFSVNSITILQGGSIIDAQVSESRFTEHEGTHPKNEFGTETSASYYAHVEDGQYYSIDAQEIQPSVRYDLTVEFEFELSSEQLSEADELQVRLRGQSTGVSYEDAIYTIRGPSGTYQTISHTTVNGVLIFSILPEDLSTYLTDGNKIVFLIEMTESNFFDISIDKLTLVSFQEWSVEHDIYRATFKFERLGGTASDKVLVGVNDNIYLTINDDSLDLKPVGQENLVSFNYNYTSQKWSAFINNDLTDRLNLVDINPTIKPRIESWYGSNAQGIIVKSVESHYYKKVKDQADFEKYKSLILSYEYFDVYAETWQADTTSVPGNVLTQLSADIDIIYSFNDEMNPNNIFSYDLLPAFTTDYFDNLGVYQYIDGAFIIDSTSSMVNSHVTSISGDSVLTSGALSNLNDADSSNAEFLTDWITERYDGSPVLTITGGDEYAPSFYSDWDIYDDTHWRYVYSEGDGSQIITIKDEYTFTGLPSWVITAADKEIEIQLDWNWYGQATDGYCKVYAMDWGNSGDGDDIYEYLGSFTRNQVETNSFTLGIQNLMRWQAGPSVTTEAKIKVEVKATDPSDPFILDLELNVDYLYLDFKKSDALTSLVSFNFGSLLDGENDFIVYFNGKTDGFTSQLLIDGTNEQSSSGTFTQFEELLLNIDSISTWIADDGEIFHPSLESRKLILDNLEIRLLSQAIDQTLANKPVGIDASASHHKSHSSLSDTDSVMFDDPFFGKNSVQFTLKNTLFTPSFGRVSASAYVDLKLNDLKFDFKVFPDASPSFVLDNTDIEGSDTSKYPPEILQDYAQYSNSRLKNSALDDIQIPLITPILLDFGQYMSVDDLARGEIEIVLDLDINLENRKKDSEWSSRFRLLLYNYTSQQWEDFNGLLRASSKGVSSFVWDPAGFSANHIDYLQDVNPSQYIPISNENDISVSNPITLKSLDDNTIQDNKIKLALISYTIPSNFSIESDPTDNYFVYERANPFVPITISQSLAVSECIVIIETQEIMYPEASLTANIPLNDDFMADLSSLNNLGEIVAVKGKFIDGELIPFEYPIEYYWINSANELTFNSPMKYQFTNVSIEYIPQLQLVYNSTDGNWYIPNLFIGDNVNFTKPFFVSDLYVNGTNKGTYIHPDVDVGYTVSANPYGTFVHFENAIHSDSVVNGSVHFGKTNEENLYRFSLADDLTYQYNILSDSSDFKDASIQLGLNVGFKNVIYSELSQVSTTDYKSTVTLYRYHKTEKVRTEIGKAIVSLDKSILGYHKYDLTINLADFSLSEVAELMLIDTLLRGTNYDLHITIESSVYNCLVDGNLFKGAFAQELLSANLKVKTDESDLSLNGQNVQVPYMPIAQDNIILSEIAPSTYQLTSLDYDYDFTIETLSSEFGILYEDIDYTFDPTEKTISLINHYRNYGGFIYASITFEAFEWKSGMISSLNPVTLTFENDYVKNISKFFEFVIQYNGIPGYDLEKIDYNSGRLVLAEEEKSSALLKIYLYNYIEERWDNVNFVVYDDYTGTNTFSYVVDRNFIVFENYFNKTQAKQFEVKAVFAVEEETNNAFISTTSFDITQINASIYYDTPDTEYMINPEVEFDIDITEFFESDNKYLEQIKLDLYYNGEIEFDDAFLFSQYALLEENYNFYFRNEYLDFEKFSLVNDEIILSRGEIDRLLFHDIDNNKYYIRAKLEYNWNVILEMNLGSNSKLDIISTLNLIKYDLFTAYTSYETTRISAQKINTSYELVKILAPNYFETDSGITVLPDDDESDIGIFGGFLRNVDTKQRLLIRQQLFYNFSSSPSETHNILLDHAYTDSILRFVEPNGWLEYPSNTILYDEYGNRLNPPLQPN
ncbi:hypothetical protein LCGC14_0951530, partial [marine sediment metagenome]